MIFLCRLALGVLMEAFQTAQLFALMSVMKLGVSCE
jgi:hypothetical protein